MKQRVIPSTFATMNSRNNPDYGLQSANHGITTEIRSLIHPSPHLPVKLMHYPGATGCQEQ